MANTEVQELIAAVAKKHKLVLAVDDPVLVTVTLNELLLERHVRKIETALQDAEKRCTSMSMEQRELAKEAARQIVTGAGDYIADRVRAAGSELETKMIEAIRCQFGNAAESSKAVRAAARTAWSVAVFALMSISLTIGMLLARWLTL